MENVKAFQRELSSLRLSTKNSHLRQVCDNIRLLFPQRN